MMPNVLFALTAGLVLVGSASPVNAQHMNALDAPCKEVAAGIEQTNCLILEAKKSDSDLNDVYRRITGVLKAADLEKLQSAERAWLLYREKACAAERGLYDGGTGGLAAYPACIYAVTRHRIIDLKTTYWWLVEKFGG